MKLSRYYQDGRYKGTAVSDREAYYQQRLTLFSELLKKHKIKKILDAGCGDGGMAYLMTKYWKSEVWGADISHKGIAIAKKNGIKAKVADLSSSLPFTSKSFDLVIANEVIEHLGSPDNFIKEVKRALRPNGLFLLTTPNLSYWLNRLLFMVGIYPLFLEASTEFKVGLGPLNGLGHGGQPVGHIHVFNLVALKDFLLRNGFSILEIRGQPVDFVSKSSSLLTRVYQTIDPIFSMRPELAADLVILAQK